jgi:hypothetical protein
MQSRVLTPVIIIGIAALYGIVCRLLFALPELQGWLQIVSIAFIYTMPLSLGGLVCLLGYKLDRPSGFWALGAPPLTMALLLFGSLLFEIEAALCVLVASPVVVPLALFGGWSMSLLLNKWDPSKLPVSVVVLLPFVVSPLERAWDSPHETRVIQDTVRIAASPEIIWSQIYAVPAIQREEIPAQWIYHLGFPRPVSAMIDHKGVGGKRHATFEGDVSFYEVVSHWEPGRKLAFSIKADPEFIPRTAFDEHIIVGGRFYDVLEGTYEIEALPSGEACLLHLSSTHRLSTHFNTYAGWWSEWVMGQIQGSILEVIKNRCENEASKVALRG